MIEVGVLKTWDSTNYKAGVQLAGSLTTYFDNISVARNIPSSAMAVGNYVIVAIPRGNPKDAAVIASWPSGGPKLNDLLDVNVPSPSNHDIIDWDAATSKWLKRSLGDMGAHASRHQYLGDDELNFARRLLALRRGMICDWQTSDNWTLYTSGSGSIAIDVMKANLETGTTQNSKASVYTGGVFAGPVGNEFVSFTCNFRGDAPHTGCEVRLWLTRGSGESPADIDNHMGFKVIDGRIWATNADGTTETSTDSGIDWGTNQTKRLAMIVSSDESTIYYYVNDVLVATHTTKLPALWGHRAMVHIINDGVAANRQFWNYMTIIEEY